MKEEDMRHHRATESASAPIGQAAADDGLPEDKYILSVWMVSGMLLVIGLGSVAGSGGVLAGLGLSGLFLFLGLVVETAAIRGRK